MEPLSKILGIAFLIFISIQLSACGKGPDGDGDDMTGQISDSFIGGTGDLASQGTTEQANGFYSRGTLLNASSLGSAGPGYFKIFLGHDTAWSTFDMITIIRDAANMMTHDYPNREPLEIGDMSHPKGGQLFLHVSHQNGLDADIRYFSKNGHVQDANSGGFDELFVSRGVVTANFDVERNFHIIQHIVGTGRVVRIFSDAAIKTSLCAYGKKIGMTPDVVETLRRLIRYPDHANHFHLRITCPLSSPHCQSQVDVPAGSGC